MPATTTTEHARRRMEAAGYLVTLDEADPGVLRAYSTVNIDEFARQVREYGSGPTATLVGMIVIRGDVITYAEFAGRVFGFWPFGTIYSSRVQRLWKTIKENPSR